MDCAVAVFNLLLLQTEDWGLIPAQGTLTDSREEAPVQGDKCDHRKYSALESRSWTRRCGLEKACPPQDLLIQTGAAEALQAFCRLWSSSCAHPNCDFHSPWIHYEVGYSENGVSDVTLEGGGVRPGWIRVLVVHPDMDPQGFLPLMGPAGGEVVVAIHRLHPSRGCFHEGIRAWAVVDQVALVAAPTTHLRIPPTPSSFGRIPDRLDGGFRSAFSELTEVSWHSSSPPTPIGSPGGRWGFWCSGGPAGPRTYLHRKI